MRPVVDSPPLFEASCSYESVAKLATRDGLLLLLVVVVVLALGVVVVVVLLLCRRVGRRRGVCGGES